MPSTPPGGKRGEAQSKYPTDEKRATCPYSLTVGGRWVDDLSHLGDDGGGEATALGMLVDEFGAVGNVDTERLVTCDIAVFPLNVLALGLHGTKNAVGLIGRALEFLSLGGADVWNRPFDHLAVHEYVFRCEKANATTGGPIGRSYPKCA